MIRPGVLALAVALAACASHGYSPDECPPPVGAHGVAPKPRAYVIDTAFTEAERAQIIDAINEWNAVGIVTPTIAYAPVYMHPLDVRDVPRGTTYVERDYPADEDTSTWGNAGESFWIGDTGERAIVYVAEQDPRVYLHELGHSFGLGHATSSACIMWGHVTSVRHVTACDYAALCAAWGCVP